MTGSHRHVVLIGPPGAGKSTVGRLVAADLGAPLVDLDVEIARTAGRSVSRIFAEQGEPAFRQLEAEAMAQALAAPPQVIVPGGGWAAQPGALESAAGALVIHLRTSVESAAARLGGKQTRPLLADEPVDALRRLLAHRMTFYQRADAEVVTDGRAPARVAIEVARIARQQAGWS